MNKNFFAGLLVGLGLLAVYAFKAAPEKPVMQKWEYKVIFEASERKTEEVMNAAGQEGWEFVSTSGASNSYLFFKRPIE